MQGKVKGSTSQSVYVGIDVSKSWLDVAMRPINKVFRVANNKKGAVSSTGQRNIVELMLLPEARNGSCPSNGIFTPAKARALEAKEGRPVA